eukprot:TRINITY_DN9001_c0_g1_i1.p1 TRINITY_DN9001_c0_g1~~TRINITY_DN9001_c0_g1_i1.p1  ORF type:complete len:258 (-),score=79.71 TRINITY_DN9001_c0_g1_i1:266-1039(-)
MESMEPLVEEGMGQSLQQRPTERLNPRQKIYLFISHCFIPTIINFFVNYGITLLRFRSNVGVSLWHFPELFVPGLIPAIVIQSTITFIMNGMLCSRDIRLGFFSVPPYSPPKFNEKIRGLAAQTPSLFQDKALLFFFSGNLDITQDGITKEERIQRIKSTIGRGLAYSLIWIVLFFPITCAVSYFIKDTINPHEAAFFAGVFCATLAFFQTPPIALIAMIRKGWKQGTYDISSSNLHASTIESPLLRHSGRKEIIVE